MFNKIVVALDINENYTPLLEQALSLAQATGSALKLLTVLTPHYGYGTSFSSYSGALDYSLTMEDSFWNTYKQQYKDLKAQGARTLSELKNQAIEKGIQTAFIQRSGDPGKVICEVATTEKADLVIVGSHGRRGLGEFLVGSVSSYVMHRAPCSVMVVRALSQAENAPQQKATEVGLEQQQ